MADREAKDRARRSRSDAPSGPGALPSEAASRSGSDQDREAKERARRSRSDAPSGPGALPSEAASRSGSAQDREAKDRARRSRSDAKSVPGASSSTSGRSGGSDREAKDRARRSKRDGPASPGAQASTESVDRGTRKQQRHSNSGKPGASSSTASEDRTTRKQQRHSSSKSKDSEPQSKTAPLDPSDGYQVEAIAVNEDEDDERVRKLEQQMQAMMASQAAAVPTAQVATAANAASDDDGVDDEDDQPCYQKYKWGIVLVVVLAIGGGVAGYFLSQGGDNAPAAPLVSGTPVPAENPTQAPNDKTTTSPSSSPTTFLIFPPPSDAECFAITNNVPLNDQDFYNTTAVSMSLDVSLTADQDTNVWLPPLEQGLQSSFVPALVGCPMQGRRLQEEENPSRYAIANADTMVSYLPNESCASGAAQPCKRVQVVLDFFVKDEFSDVF